MHEMSIAQGIFDIVKEEMVRHEVQKLESINIATGKLAAIVPQHLKLCFEMIADGTELAGTNLNIREIPLGYLCRACGEEFDSEQMEFTCISCGEENPTLIRGRELTIENIEVGE